MKLQINLPFDIYENGWISNRCRRLSTNLTFSVFQEIDYWVHTDTFFFSVFLFQYETVVGLENFHPDGARRGRLRRKYSNIFVRIKRWRIFKKKYNRDIRNGRFYFAPIAVYFTRLRIEYEFENWKKKNDRRIFSYPRVVYYIYYAR